MANNLNINYKILIVDDVVHNIQVLINILKEAGYELGFAKDGKTALTHTKTTSFDLILLDIMMPGIDGYEVCAQLKKDKNRKDIPIIFITARNDTEAKTRGFELGAVDYITKPFDPQEVLARVKTHLTLRSYTTRLEQMVEDRTQQLIQADRLATLGTFSAAVVHEVNNPLSYIISNAKLIKHFWISFKPIIEKCVNEINEDTIDDLADEIIDVDEWLKDLIDGGNRISRLVNSLKTYSRQSETFKEKIPLINIINDAINLVGHKLKFCSVHIEININSEIFIYCDRQKMSQVFVNLINNSCDAIKEPNGHISINATLVDEQIEIKIKDSGPGISYETADKIFNPFFTTKSRNQGTGLGLFIVNNIIKEHKGQISLLSFNDEGAGFKILLPVPK